MNVIKRDGRVVDFDYSRILVAITKAFNATCETTTYDQNQKRNRDIEAVAFRVHMDCVGMQDEKASISVEAIQDLVERELMRMDNCDVAKAYIIYRDNRSRVRNMNTDIMRAVKEITFTAAADSDTKRENGNVDADGPMGKMLKQGGEVGKALAESEIMKPEHARAHREGDIHVHDEDFYSTGTQTCCQIDADKLLTGGFSTGHGYLREPGNIHSCAALTCISIQANQNSMHI